jgi:hypothetical protein
MLSVGALSASRFRPDVSTKPQRFGAAVSALTTDDPEHRLVELARARCRFWRSEYADATTRWSFPGVRTREDCR